MPTSARRLAAVADQLIPAAHGMPSAAEVARATIGCGSCSTPGPTCIEPSEPRCGPSSATTSRRDSTRSGGTSRRTSVRSSSSIVAGYYTDSDVRDRIGYPGQMALTLRSWEVPAYIDEGLIDAVLARGPVWRDPATGMRAVATDAPRTYAERFAAPPEGESDGHHGA